MKMGAKQDKALKNQPQAWTGTCLCRIERAHQEETEQFQRSDNKLFLTNTPANAAVRGASECREILNW
jgi:hypothetical protein